MNRSCARALETTPQGGRDGARSRTCLNDYAHRSLNSPARANSLRAPLPSGSAGWLTERALSLLWKKFLEKEAPRALREMSELLATDLVTGMALMAMLALFVPPMAQMIFNLSALFSRFMELRSKRMSHRDYIAGIAGEAISLAKEAREITVQDRWVYDDPSLPT